MIAMRNRLAFTLFELLLVLAALTVMTTLALPAAKSWRSRASTDRSIAEVCRLVQEAKLRATREGRSWSLRYDGTPVTLYLAPTSEAYARVGVAQIDADSVGSHVLPSDMNVEFVGLNARAITHELCLSPVGAISAVRIVFRHQGIPVASLAADRLTGGLVKESQQASAPGSS
jgi:type II secretory pathway pseudopilin PulG